MSEDRRRGRYSAWQITNLLGTRPGGDADGIPGKKTCDLLEVPRT